MAGLIIGICWYIFNITIVIPCAIFVFYTINSVIPVLAAVADQKPSHNGLQLHQTVEEGLDEAPTGVVSVWKTPNPIGVRYLLRLLSSDRKCLSLPHGFGWHLLWNMVKGSLLLALIWLPSAVGLLAQILVPMALIQLHTLWVHTIIAPSNPDPFWKRIVPAREAFKAAGLPMFILLTAEAATQRILLNTYKGMEIKWEDFFPLGSDNEKALQFCLLAVVLTFTIVVPAHLLLVRVQTSLLPSDVRTIVPLDLAFTGTSKYERMHMTLREACQSLNRTLLTGQVIVHLKIILITVLSVVVVGFIDFEWYIIIAIMNWRF